MSDTPLYIRVRDTDNVAIVVNAGGLPKGTVFSGGLTLLEHVPQGHKVNLTDIAEGAPILRYGEVIGTAARPIPRGSWVQESLVRMPAAPSLENLPLATRVPRPQPPLEGYTFEGYRNADGTPNYEMAPYTVVDATHMQLTLAKPHIANATITVGGLCGYGLEQTVDTHIGIRQVFPVVGSTYVPECDPE